jgi:hypothetical protein
MLLRSLLSLPIVCLVIGTLWAANDPFVGKWKVNPSKSKLTDEMKVEAVGENKYMITFSPDAGVNERSVEISYKFKGKITGIDRAFSRSQDLDDDRAPGGSKQAQEHSCL